MTSCFTDWIIAFGGAYHSQLCLGIRGASGMLGIEPEMKHAKQAPLLYCLPGLKNGFYFLCSCTFITSTHPGTLVLCWAESKR